MSPNQRLRALSLTVIQWKAAMNGKKILLLVVAVLVVAGAVVGTILHSRSNVPAVTTAKAVRQDLIATVSGHRPDQAQDLRQCWGPLRSAASPTCM